MIREAVILAGGFGSRLRHVVQDVPKPMAPINGRPFLEYLILYLKNKGINRMVLSVSYMHDLIESYFGQQFADVDIVYAREESPLGTGGGLFFALQRVLSDDVLIVNGDSFISFDMERLRQIHTDNNATLTLTLKLMQNFDRYGCVVLNHQDVVAFQEKQWMAEGYINAGVYLLNKSKVFKFNMPEKFSFEKEFMEVFLNDLQMKAYISDGYFIDIGIPQDYEKAQQELPIQLRAENVKLS